MANDQSETPVPSTPQNATQDGAPAVAVEAGKAVEDALTATSNPISDPNGYTAPTDDHKADFENGTFGDEADYVVEPAAPDADAPDKTRVPESVVGGHP
jgi:hypothetical protein